MTEPTESCFIFIVKTNCYAGNFEREMCAFMTGILGDCGVGDISAELYSKQCPGANPWEEKVIQVADGHGCYRPVSNWNTGKGWNDVAIFLEKRPTDEEITFLRKRAMLFALDPREEDRKRLKIEGFELIEYKIEVEQSRLQSYPPMETFGCSITG